MSETNQTFKPISRFGIGILACFMVCDSMEVETKKVLGSYQTDDALKVSVEGYDSLLVITSGNRREPGTKTVLKLRKTHPWLRMSNDEFINCVKKLIPNPPFIIDVQAGDIIDICSPDSFEGLELKIERDYSWKNEGNIKIVEIDLNSPDKGFRGKAEVAYISNSSGHILESLNICQKM